MLEGSLDSTEIQEELAAEMNIILGEHRRLWTARNRVGGLQDSERAFEERLREYEGTRTSSHAARHTDVVPRS
jgi:hypothetical protein